MKCPKCGGRIIARGQESRAVYHRLVLKEGRLIFGSRIRVSGLEASDAVNQAECEGCGHEFGGFETPEEGQRTLCNIKEADR